MQQHLICQAKWRHAINLLNDSKSGNISGIESVALKIPLPARCCCKQWSEFSKQLLVRLLAVAHAGPRAKRACPAVATTRTDCRHAASASSEFSPPRVEALRSMARPSVYDRTAVMHRNQTWHAGSPKRWRMFLYKYVQNPNARRGKSLPEKALSPAVAELKRESCLQSAES